MDAEDKIDGVATRCPMRGLTAVHGGHEEEEEEREREGWQLRRYYGRQKCAL